VEIKKETIYFYTITLLALGITFYTFLMVNEKQMRIKTTLERTKMLRTKANAGSKGASIVSERELANQESGKAIY
jgi:hypothetical protein